MRITFLCSSLEPGRDGVGDYTRRLAAELMRGGHECQLVALHDRWVTTVEASREGFSYAFGSEELVPAILRLPAQGEWEERMRLAAPFIARFKPEWVSLQFVPYGFHDKGLSLDLGRHLARVTSAYRLHVMFHELWIGDTARAPWKERFVGALQRACIFHLVRQTAPECVTTTNGVYRAMLKRRNCEAPLLQLFGNIPIAPRAEISGRNATDRSDVWTFVFFGTLHPEWKPEPLFSLIQRAAVRAGKAVVMLAVGRLGPGEALWERLSREHGDAFRFIALGEQPASRVSEVLQAADAGIAVSPWELMGKSGSAATMVEHGLPVIVTRHEASATVNGRYFACDDLLEEKLVRGLPKDAPASRLPSVAADVVRLLGHDGARLPAVSHALL